MEEFHVKCKYLNMIFKYNFIISLRGVSYDKIIIYFYNCICFYSI